MTAIHHADPLLDPLFTSDAAADAFSPTARLQAMLEFEAALARAEAAVGVIPAHAVPAIEASCKADLYDLGALGAGAALAGNTAIPMVKHLTRVVKAADEGDKLHEQTGLAVGVETVKHNFERYGVLDDRVRFLVGWFKDTLPTAPVEQLSLMRLDGDMYESTIQAIEPLYPKLSPGGFCIIDDFGSHASQAGQAVHDYRAQHGITDEIVQIDEFGAYWRKSG